MSESFGKKLRKLRVKRGYTLAELAELVESKKDYIWQLENKHRANPSGELLIKLSNVLSVSPDFLLDDTRSQQSNRQVADTLFRKMEEENLTIEEVEAFFDVIKKIRSKNP